MTTYRDRQPPEEEEIDTGVIAEVPEDERLDFDEGTDGSDASEGGTDDDLDDIYAIYADPGEVVEHELG